MTELSFLKINPPWEWPPDSADVLTAILQDPDSESSDRLEAADLAGDLTSMDDEMAEVLVGVVENPAEDPEVRATAAISLGPVLETTEIEGFDDVLSEPPITRETFDHIQDTLHHVYADESAPKEVRRRALEASVRAAQDWHADAIRDAYSSGDKEWMTTAVFGMQWVDGFEREILKSLENPDPEIHIEAVKAAGAREVEEAWEHVVDLVRTPGTEKNLLLAAIEAVGVLRPRETADVLEDLSSSEDEEISEAVDEALMMAHTELGLTSDEMEEDEEDEEEDEDEDEDEEEEQDEQADSRH